MMEKLLFVRPTLQHEKEAVAYINEMLESNSDTSGTNGLKRYTDNYLAWLKKLNVERNTLITKQTAPAETFFLIRKSDKKLLGISSIRFGSLEDEDKYLDYLINGTKPDVDFTEQKFKLVFYGNIGYGIRPSERRKGYAKYQLYQDLKFCDKINLDKAIVCCEKPNIASSKAIQFCGGELICEIQQSNGEILQRYEIDVKESLDRLDAFYKK